MVAETVKVHDAAGLTAALAKAGAGETITLGADLQWNGPRPIALRAGVTLDGGGHTITNDTKGPLVDQVGARDVVLRNVGLATKQYLAWTIAVKNGDLRLERCDLRCRLIAWEKGALTIEKCQVAVQLPRGNDNSGPIGVYGGGASLTAAECVFKFGWDVQHVAMGFFHNFGGQPASRLFVLKCSIIGGADPNHSADNRLLSVFQSDNAAGPGYETRVTDCVIFAEVKSVFRSSGTGEVSSSHNNNAGMLRNPGILAGSDPLGTNLYESAAAENPVKNKSGDIEELNPFVDAPKGDYRIVSGTNTATAASDGGALGANRDVVPREMNAYDLSFDQYVAVEHRTKGYQEELFDGWPVKRDTDQQLCRLIREGSGIFAMRLETRRNDEGTGGANKMITQHALQSFAAVPGWQYTIRASARRGRMPLVGTWEESGSHVHAILGAADGHSTDPDKLIASKELDSPENEWFTVQVEVTAPSNRLTIHLIHRTDRDWNHVDWAGVAITARAPVGARIPPGLRGPVLAYINSIPPERDDARAARHKKVAERRAHVPIVIHRGAHKFDPENTLEAYDRVIALGADGVEFDPRITKDGVIYTLHDPDVGRMLSGHGHGDQMTYYELSGLPFKDIRGNATRQTRVPTIASLFQLARERAMLLHFDVKETGIEDLLITMLDRFDMWDHMVFVTPSPDSNRLRFHPKAKLLQYKAEPDYGNPESVKKALAGPGEMFYRDADPSPIVKALGRPAPGDQPLPDTIRAWWWPDGSSVPVERADKPAALEHKQ